MGQSFLQPGYLHASDERHIIPSVFYSAVSRSSCAGAGSSRSGRHVSTAEGEMRMGKLTLAVIAIGAILLVVSVTMLPLTVLLPVTVLHVAIAVLRAPRAVPPAIVTPAVIVALPPVLVIVATTARWGYGAAAATSATWGTLTARWTAGIETPASRRRSTCPLGSCQLHLSVL